MAQALSQQKVHYLGSDVELPPHCPLRDPAVHGQFVATLRGAGQLSTSIQTHMVRQPDAAQWLRAAVEAARPLLRPWAMEIVFLVGALGTARFKDLEGGLGISSKVLSLRLREWVDSGHVERVVHAEVPVRITYALTKRGRATAALATPLFAHLNLVQGMPTDAAMPQARRR